MISATIHLPTLAAVSAFAPKEPTRTYLRGVYTTIDADGATYVAIDGHRLAARRVNLDKDAERNTLLGSWIIPTASCRALKIPKRSAALATLRPADAALELELDGAFHKFLPVDGTFPDWRRVVPQETSGVLKMNINGDYLASVFAFGKALDLGLPIPHWNDEDPAAFTFARDPDTLLVVMPMRVKDRADYALPDFVRAA